jgi:DNA-binding SARP family transcriptional activator
MQVRILGPFEVLATDGTKVLLPPSQARLLARLVVSANRIVSADRLIDDMWDGSPPREADSTFRAHLSKLRKALAERERIVAEAGGYRLVVAADESDVSQFEAALAVARRESQRGDLSRAAVSFRRALGLWRGTVLAGLSDLPWVQAYAAELEEERVAATEEMVEARLAAGDHGGVVGELEALTQAYPYRERLWAARMLALYRCGRQVEALRAYECLRVNLRDELGIEPSREVGQLERAILAHDPSLANRGGGPGHATRRKLPVQRSSFVGRQVERTR